MGNILDLNEDSFEVGNRHFVIRKVDHVADMITLNKSLLSVWTDWAKPGERLRQFHLFSIEANPGNYTLLGFFKQLYHLQPMLIPVLKKRGKNIDENWVIIERN